MRTCPECGNHDMRVRTVRGSSVHECGLCGAQFGDPHAVRRLDDDDQARALGCDPEVWPLAAVLAKLPGLELAKGRDGDVVAGRLPRLEMIVADGRATVSLENLAKSLRLCAGALRCRWRLELCFEQTLCLVVAPDAGQSVRDAHIDVEQLARSIDRDSRLSWWRHANAARNG